MIHFRFLSAAVPAMIASGCFTAAPTEAQSREIETVWMINPGTLSTETFTVAEGALVFSQPLRPLGLVVLGKDVMFSGKVVVAAGEQLMKALADRPVYCALSVHKAGTLETMFVSTLRQRTRCLMDSDGDGRFDEYFTNKVQYYGIPISRGKYPAVSDKISPVSFNETDVSAYISPYKVDIEYAHGSSPGKYFFKIRFGDESDHQYISQDVFVRDKSFPANVEILGSQFKILSEKDDEISVQLVRPMPVQPFSVVRR